MRLRWAVISVLITGLLLALRHLSPSIAAGSNPVPQKLSLWPAELAPPYDHRISTQLRARLFPNPPLRDRDLSRYRPSMQTFLLSVATPRPAVLVFPGGGYGMLSQREGLAVCRFLNQRAKVHAILVDEGSSRDLGVCSAVMCVCGMSEYRFHGCTAPKVACGAS